MTKQETDELIETAKNYIETYEEGDAFYITDDNLWLVNIALATLKDHKNGFVGVPSEPTASMQSGLYHSLERAEYIGYQDRHKRDEATLNIARDIIAVAPQSEVSKILGGNYE